MEQRTWQQVAVVHAHHVRWHVISHVVLRKFRRLAHLQCVECEAAPQFGSESQSRRAAVAWAGGAAPKRAKL
jgi:hypothetical protein